MIFLNFRQNNCKERKIFSLRWLRRVKIIKKEETRVTPAPALLFGRFKPTHLAQVSSP